MSSKLVYVIVMIAISSSFCEFITKGSFGRMDMPNVSNSLANTKYFTMDEELAQENIIFKEPKKNVKGYFQPSCNEINLTQDKKGVESIANTPEIDDFYKFVLDKTIVNITKAFPDVLNGFISLCVAKFDITQTNTIISTGDQSSNNYSGVFPLCQKVVDCENDEKVEKDDSELLPVLAQLEQEYDAINEKRNAVLASIGQLQFEIGDLQKELESAEEDQKEAIQEQITAKEQEIETHDPDQFDDELTVADQNVYKVKSQIKARHEIVALNTKDSKGKKKIIPYCLNNLNCINDNGIAGAYTSHMIMIVPNSTKAKLSSKLTDLKFAKDFASKKHVGYMVGYIGINNIEEIDSSESMDSFEELRGQQIYYFENVGSNRILI